MPWRDSTYSCVLARIDSTGMETETYDYSTERGHLELDNDPHDPAAARMPDVLPNEVVSTELRAPLPLRYRLPQALSRKGYLAYNEFTRNYTPSDDSQTPLPALLGYGKECKLQSDSSKSALVDLP